MKHMNIKAVLATLIVILAGGLPSFAQSCQTRDEVAAPVKTAIENAAQQIFQQASQGDVNALRSSAAPSFADGFINLINGNKAAVTGATAQLRTSFLLDTGPNPPQDGNYYCGVFGANGMSANGAAFNIPGLPVGKYGVVIQDVTGSKGPYAVTAIFQDMNGWKVAGYNIRPEAINGHDGIWYLERARDYKSKGQNHNAWFYYYTSWDLLAPVRFMDTRLLTKITQESTNVQPKDVPAGGNPATFSANGKTYQITDMSVFPNANNFDLQVKYSVPSTADFNATQTDARNLATALVTQYPELRDGFNKIWAHAVDPSGGDVVGLITLKQ